MEKKKVFLASASELENERNSFAKFIREINEVMKFQNIELEAEQWEFKDKAIQGSRIQDLYNKVLADCEICIVLFWTRCGKYTQEELRFAYDKFKEGLNPRKIYVFFKNDSSRSCSEELIEFKKEFPQKYNENFPIDYSNVNELQYLLFLEIAKYFGDDSVQFKFNNKLIDFSKLPCFKRNKDYSEILRSYKKAVEHSSRYPNDKSFVRDKDFYESKLNDILVDLIKTARIVDEIERVDSVSNDVNKAIRHLFQLCRYEDVKKIAESVTNPFKISGDIKPEFFCDRIKEGESFDRHLLNGENLLLIAPRHSGKTAFIRNRMYDSSTLSSSHYFAYCDLLAVHSIEDFAVSLSRSVERMAVRKSNGLSSLLKFFKSLSSPTLSLDPVDGTVHISFGVSDFAHAIEVINDCFKYLEQLDKPCVLCLDEFQQLNSLDSLEQVEGIIYNYMNTLNNVRFVLIGCPRLYSDYPKLGIKQSIIERCTFFPFEPIKREDYQVFAKYWFNAYSKEINSTAFSYIYDYCQKSPFYIQRVLNRLFMETKPGEICQRENASVIIDSMVRESAPIYCGVLSHLSARMKKVLQGISEIGEVSDYRALVKQIGPNSSPSSILHCINRLIDQEIISYYNNKYYIEDVFFSHFLNSQWQVGDSNSE